MPLVHLCYRCPECGHDPMEGEGDLARCRSCGLRVERARGSLVMTDRGGNRGRDVTAAILSRKIDAFGGPMTRATGPGGVLTYSATAMVSWRTSEKAVWYRGVLRGFTESMGPPLRGTIAVDREGVAIDDRPHGHRRWRHLDIGAIQASSSSLQLSLPDDSLVQLRFLDDSPRRWEELMRRLVTEAYERAGRGRVVEFQPRVVTG